MACFEHNCRDIVCGYSTFNNFASSPKVCPKCGADLNHFCDEEPYEEYVDQYSEDDEDD